MSDSYLTDDLIRKHTKYFIRCLNMLPSQYTEIESNRMSLLFFGVLGLAVLGTLESATTKEQRNSWSAWIMSCQIGSGGFRGSPLMELRRERYDFGSYDVPHLPSTYFALITLLHLKHDIKKLNGSEILQWIKTLQTSSGKSTSLRCLGQSDIFDVRFSYFIAVIRRILHVHGFVTKEDTEAPVQHVLACESPFGGFAQDWSLEAHGGHTFCSLATLKLYSALEQDSHINTLKFLNARMNKDGGMNGRPNKISDTCYSFWNAASLAMLGHLDFIDQTAARHFLLTQTASQFGGFGKSPGDPPDLLHSSLGLCALSLLGDKGLRPLDPTVCVSRDHLNNLT